MKFELCFIRILLSLTLNITPVSLGSDCYLGTLNWNIKNWMEVLWKNMSDFYLFLISKRNWFSWPVLTCNYVNCSDSENQAENRVKNRMTIRELPNTELYPVLHPPWWQDIKHPIKFALGVPTPTLVPW
jgi:hypothetical protein